VEYGFLRAVNRFMAMPDLQIASATPLATWRGAGVLYFNWWFIVPVTGFALLLYTLGENRSLRYNLAIFTGFFLCSTMLGLSHTFSKSTWSLGSSFSSFYQTIAQFAVENLFPAEREALTFQQPDLPQKNIILVIDESIRGDHLSINGYERETTPVLEKLARLEGILHNWGLAVAGATCSYPSNALILTGVRPGRDAFIDTEKYPTVFQYAKAMGYVTHYMDIQTNSLWNGLTDEDIVYIDNWHKAIDFGENDSSDFRSADLIAKIVSSGTGNFIVLNKRGVHFLYEDTYPDDSTVWAPIPSDYMREPELVKNPYDNGIRYNVNTFFERLLKNPSILENTTILYTSDHGQTLFENHVSWLHCNFTQQEATVPLIILGMNLPKVDTSFPASHENILPTILDLMNIPPAQWAHPYAPSLFDATRDLYPDRFFLNGSLERVDFPDP